MKEDFLVYIWKHRLLQRKKLATSDGKSLEILFPGYENTNAGPDFLAAQIRIDGTLWAGNVEIHVMSSYWYIHKHHADKSYDNIILHVVYECDKEAARMNGGTIPHLVLKNYTDPQLETRYQMLMQNKHLIPCEKLLGTVNNSTFKLWIYRLLICRLERKAIDAARFLNYFENDWEHLCLYLIARYLGGKPNASTFGLLIQRTPHRLLIKNHDNSMALEALLFGQAGLLEKDFHESYPVQLKNEYKYLCKKYELPERLEERLWKYSRMRPANFPDVRISQLAAMIRASQGKLFQQLLGMKEIKTLYEIMRAKVNSYWDTHYRLDTVSKKTGKKMGAAAADNIMINAVAPLFFVYGKERHRQYILDHGLDLLSEIKAEKNRVIKIWKQLGRIPDNASESQGMTELYIQYCMPRKCLKCSVGHQVLKRGPALS